MIGDFQKSPYKHRTFIVLDSVHTAGTVEDLVKIGAERPNIVVWQNNGIEYVYPAEEMSKVFACSAEKVSEVKIEGDTVAMNGVTKRKPELSREICSSLTVNTDYPEELLNKLIQPLKVAVGI